MFKQPLFIISLYLLFCFFSASAQEKPEIEGVWKGRFKIDFVFKINRMPDGRLSATFNTPIQKVYNVPVKDISFNDDSLYLGIEVSDVNKSHFSGRFNKDKNTISGSFFDGVYYYPLTLEAGFELVAEMVPRMDNSGNQIFNWLYKIPENLGDGWAVGDIRESGIDTATIFEAMNKITREDYKLIKSMLIIKDGKLLLDEYFYGYNNRKLHFIASITKGITCLLSGITLEKGLVKSMDEPVCNLMPEYSDLLCGGGKENILFYHLLSMSAGLDWDEQTYNYLDSRNTAYAMGHSGDAFRYLFGRELIYTPGEKFVYNSGLTNATCEIIQEKWGKTIEELAIENIFTPLGIEDYYWEKNKDGSYHASGGLSLYPRDLAKIGMLYVDKGIYKNKRIIKEEWFDNCTEKYYTGEGPDYWNHWGPDIRFIKGKPVEVFSSGGLGGQFIFAMPELNTIVTFNSDYFGFPWQMHEILNNYVIPAIISGDDYSGQKNFTSKNIRMLVNYNWGYSWISELACLVPALKVIGKENSMSWLSGATGHAFQINIKEGLSANINEAVNLIPRPGKGLGYSIDIVESSPGDEDFEAKQKQAWDMTREAVDNGLPVYARQMDWIDEYFLIFGYDETGYYYKGIDSFEGKGAKYWKEAGLGGNNKLLFKKVSPAEKSEDKTIIKEALKFAVSYSSVVNDQSYISGTEAYKKWGEYLLSENADIYGAALNAAAWTECRKHAVGFLEECKIRLPHSDLELFDQAIKKYQTVVDCLSEVQSLFPFFVSNEIKQMNVKDMDKCGKAASILEKAGTAEKEGIVILEKILKTLD